MLLLCYSYTQQITAVLVRFSPYFWSTASSNSSPLSCEKFAHLYWPFLEYHPVSSWVFHGVSHGVSGLVLENPSDVGFWSLRSSSLISSCSSACSSKSWEIKKHRKTKAIYTTAYNLGHSWIQWTLRILRILRRMSSNVFTFEVPLYKIGNFVGNSRSHSHNSHISRNGDTDMTAPIRPSNCLVEIRELLLLRVLLRVLRGVPRLPLWLRQNSLHRSDRSDRLSEAFMAFMAFMASNVSRSVTDTKWYKVMTK